VNTLKLHARASGAHNALDTSTANGSEAAELLLAEGRACRNKELSGCSRA
jgi:hypothetical protein